MTDAQIVMLIMGIFYAAGFVGLIVLEVHLIRILISLRPENCEKCTGYLKESNLEVIYPKKYDFKKLVYWFSYKYAYRVDGTEYELTGCMEKMKPKDEEFRDDDYTLALNRKKEEESPFNIPETIEVFYSEKCPKRGYSAEVNAGAQSGLYKFSVGIVAFFIIVCLWAAAFSFTHIL